MAEVAARKKGRHTEAQWDVVLHLSQNMCLQCLRPATMTRLSKDHIVPITAGGSDDIMNLQPMCRDCNIQKGRGIQDLRGSALAGMIYDATRDVRIVSRRPAGPVLTWTMAEKMQAAMGAHDPLAL